MTDSIRLTDVNGQHFAEFLMLDDHIIGIPGTAMTAEYLKDQSLPIWVPPGCHYQPQAFLEYLAKVASSTEYPYYFWASSRTYQVALTRYMNAEDLVQLTGYDVEKVRKFLAGHLTFKEQT